MHVKLLLLFLLLIASGAPSWATEFARYSTKGVERARGVSISFDYPVNWGARSNGSAGVVQEFRDARAGGRDALLLVVPAVGPQKPTAEAFRREFSAPESDAALFPGAKHRRRALIEGVEFPCVCYDYDLPLPQVAPAVVQVRNFILLVDGQMVQLQFYGVAPAERDLRAERAEMMQHVLRSVRRD